MIIGILHAFICYLDSDYTSFVDDLIGIIETLKALADYVKIQQRGNNNGSTTIFNTSATYFHRILAHDGGSCKLV